MSDIVLAECNGQVWLVGGEQYIDDLLANTLDPHVSIEIIPCETHAGVTALWEQHSDNADEASAPWVIHPAIANRVRGASGGHSVFFAQWSAMLDDTAKTVVRSAASWAAQRAEEKIALIRYVAPSSAPMLAELANLRAGLIEAELTAQGVAAGRIVRETRDVASMPGMAEESQRVDIIVLPA